ncbi:suppressor of fused domain protein [Inquilinus limosus]|uniref:suppressor of fused domain protein n=1 Tax=Inquilinus limosus TaxID=171674 RepID=UPI003F14A4D1
MPVSAENRTLFQYLRIMFGGSPKMKSYLDENNESSVDILTAADVPHKNVTTYSTIGLSDASIGLVVEGVPLGVEIALSARSNYDYAANILATCAFNIINSKMSCRPGVIYPRVIEMYNSTLAMKHVMCVDHFLWPLRTHKFPTKQVAWLFAVPISDGEFEMAQKNGGDALSKAFEKHKIDVFNLHRKSIL